MTDPTRLLDEGGTGLEARLLRSGKAEGPSPAAMAHALAVARQSAPPRGAPMPRANGQRGSLAKWVGVGALGLVLIGVAVVASTKAPPVTPQPAASVAAARAASVSPPQVENTPWVTVPKDPITPLPPAPAIAPPAPRGPHTMVAPAATSSIGSSEPIDDSFAAELRAIEQARRTIAGRDYAGALRLLDDWAVTFPRKRFDEEAAVLRIEAVSGNGDREGGYRLAQQFLAAHP